MPVKRKRNLFSNAKEAPVIRRRLIVLVAVYTVVAGVADIRADNWPAWRGPDNNGICQETRLPTTWSETTNVAWKVPLPGQGGSTPVVWGDRIFLTSAEGNDFVLFCISTGGKQLWKRSVGSGGRTTIMRGEGNDASASPSTDGKHVYAYVGTGDLACFDFAGKEIWKFNVQERYGKFSIQHGIHSTPLLHEDRLYLPVLHNRGHWVSALDKATGKEIWKVERKTDAQGESRETYASPVLWKTAKDTSLVILGCDYATGHRLSDGGEIWRLGDLNPKTNYSNAFRIITSPVASADVLVVPTCRNGIVVALKPNPVGMIQANSPFELWRKPKGAPDVPSPLIHDGLVYLATAELGMLRCWDAKTGQEYYGERIHNDRYRASPVYADGKIYLMARDGTALVVQAGPKFQPLATNKLNDNFTASPAIADGRIYLRGFNALYAIQDKGK
jgi:outer membrane protein assembly factor BamB